MQAAADHHLGICGGGAIVSNGIRCDNKHISRQHQTLSLSSSDGRFGQRSCYASGVCHWPAAASRLYRFIALAVAIYAGTDARLPHRPDIFFPPFLINGRCRGSVTGNNLKPCFAAQVTDDRQRHLLGYSPQPHFGTVEVRVMRYVPTTVNMAAGLIQATARNLLLNARLNIRRKDTCCINSTVSGPRCWAGRRRYRSACKSSVTNGMRALEKSPSAGGASGAVETAVGRDGLDDAANA